MKKILFLLLLTVVFGACESDTDSNWNNRPGGNSDDTQNWDSYVITVKNWERIGGVNADNSFFRCVVEDEYLDQYIFDKGSVMVYLIQYDGDVPVQTPLPYVMHYADGDNLWTETFSYDYSVGSFAFYVTYSDFFTEISPGECQFKVVMHW